MFWWGILRKSSIPTASNRPLPGLKHVNQRRWWQYKVVTPSNIKKIRWGSNRHSFDPSQKELYRAQCSGQASGARMPAEQHVIFRCKSWNIRAKGGGDSVKFGAHPKLQFSMGLNSTQSWPESKRTISSLMFWRGILRTRQACKLPLQVENFEPEKVVILQSLGPIQNYNFGWVSNLDSFDLSQKESDRDECSGEEACARSEQHAMFGCKSKNIWSKEDGDRTNFGPHPKL